MIERGSIDYPSLPVLVVLCLVSLSFTFFMGLTAQSAGLLLVFWGFFAVMRALWIVEGVRSIEVVGARRSTLLPWVILNEMSWRSRHARVRNILQVFNWPMFLSAGLVVLYVLVQLYGAFFAAAPIKQDDAFVLISAFFDAEGVSPSFDRAETFIEIGGVLVIGLSCLLMKTYVYVGRVAQYLFFGVFVCFVLACGFLLFSPMSFGFYFSFSFGDIIISLVMGVLLFVFFYAFFTDLTCRVYALFGVGALCVLALGYVFTIGSFSLWFSGWSMVAILWSRVLPAVPDIKHN